MTNEKKKKKKKKKKRNKANSTDTEIPMLDLPLSGFDGAISSNVYDKQDHFRVYSFGWRFPRSSSYRKQQYP